MAVSAAPCNVLAAPCGMLAVLHGMLAALRGVLAAPHGMLALQETYGNSIPKVPYPDFRVLFLGNHTLISEYHTL